MFRMIPQALSIQLLALSAAVMPWAACRAAAPAARPNIVIFIADDMGWNDCGAYGHPHLRTPNIDRLAKEGLRFDRAALTCSSCSPSRSSILTGRYPHSTGAGELHLPLPAEAVLVTTPLREAGYWTACVGKWHLGEAVIGQVDLRRDSSPEKMGEAWVRALRERPADKPFFLWAAHHDPHRGYKPGAIDPPHTGADAVVPPFLPDVPAVRDDLALYYDEIGRFDQHIGMALAELDRQGAAERTLVLVMSDNGRPFPHCKTQVTVPGSRTPFIVRWPGRVKPGGVTQRVVSSVDIAPTLLDLAGIARPPDFQGVSFVPVLDDPVAVVRPYAFAEHNWHDYRAFERGVHGERYCYVRNWLPDTPATPPADAVRSPTYDAMQQLFKEGKLDAVQRACMVTPRPEEFLYDVVTDPHCTVNLAADPAHRASLQVMRKALAAWQAETGDRFPGEENLTPDGFDRVTGRRVIPAAHPSRATEKP